MGANTYFGTSINESPTIVLPAGEEIQDARGIALVIKEGAVVKPDAGANIIGISVIETEDMVVQGEDVTVQIKDIGKWVAGEEIVIGTELATDAEGKAVAASDGDFIVAVALSNATEAGSWVKAQIIKGGYKTAAQVGNKTEGGN